MKQKTKVIIWVPICFSIRDFIFTSVWDEMLKNQQTEFHLLVDDLSLVPNHKKEAVNIFFHCTSQTNKASSHVIKKFSLKRKLANYIRLYYYSFLFYSFIYRFGAIHNLGSYQVRKKHSVKEQNFQQIFLEYKLAEKAGQPFPKSRTLFTFLYQLVYLFDPGFNQGHVDLFEKIKPDLMVFGRLHMPNTLYWSKLAKKMDIPMVGYISSWDHLTTKGPLPKGMSKYIVSSETMVEELINLHKVLPKQIDQIGKVQMDYFLNKTICSRDELMKSLEIPTGYQLITLGTNAAGLKRHEVSIASYLAKKISSGEFGQCSLLIRTHPLDRSWQKDFAHLGEFANVRCINANSFATSHTSEMDEDSDQQFLAALMKHSSIVIQSRGSLALDAVAFDTPVISLAFDGEMDMEEKDQFIYNYRFDHYIPIVKNRATWMAGSYGSLDRAITAYLSDKSIHTKGRALLRQEQLAPFDGKSGQRMVNAIISSAEEAKQGQLYGNWNISGLGDSSWAKKRVINILNYLD